MTSTRARFEAQVLPHLIVTPQVLHTGRQPAATCTGPMAPYAWGHPGWERGQARTSLKLSRARGGHGSEAHYSTAHFSVVHCSALKPMRVHRLHPCTAQPAEAMQAMRMQMCHPRSIASCNKSQPHMHGFPGAGATMHTRTDVFTSSGLHHS